MGWNVDQIQGFTDQNWCLSGDEDAQKPGAKVGDTRIVIVVAIKDAVNVSGKAETYKETYSNDVALVGLRVELAVNWHQLRS